MRGWYSTKFSPPRTKAKKGALPIKSGKVGKSGEKWEKVGESMCTVCQGVPLLFARRVYLRQHLLPTHLPPLTTRRSGQALLRLMSRSVTALANIVTATLSFLCGDGNGCVGYNNFGHRAMTSRLRLCTNSPFIFLCRFPSQCWRKCFTMVRSSPHALHLNTGQPCFVCPQWEVLFDSISAGLGSGSRAASDIDLETQI